HDLPALRVALDAGREVIPVFCFDPQLVHGRHASASRTRFLIESLASLDRSFRARGSGLVVRHGDPAIELPRLAEESRARALHHSADAGPFARARDAHVRAALGEVGVEVHAHPGMFVAHDLGELTTTGGTPYTVFSPFWRSWSRLDRREVLAAPRKLPP